MTEKLKIGAVIVAAGYGSFRSEEGTPVPKVLERVGGVPMVCRVATRAVCAGLHPCVVVVNPLFEKHIQHALYLCGLGRELLWAVQPDRFGPADAAMRAVPLLREKGADSFLMAYADMPLFQEATYRRLIALHREREAAVTMTTVSLKPSCTPNELRRYGRIMRDHMKGISYIVEPDEATKEELAASDSVNPSFWAWSTNWFANHAEKTPFYAKKDGRASERRVPPLVALAWEEGSRVNELLLTDPTEALGVNDIGELQTADLVWQVRHVVSEMSI